MRLRFRLASLAALTVAILLCFACSATKPAETRAPLDTTRGAASGEAKPPTAVASPTVADRPEQSLAKVPVSAADPQWGSVDAPVTIVEFSDFQCPFCSRVGPTLEQLKQKYGPTQLRIVFKHNPLPFHERARPTAETAAAVFMLAGSEAFFAFHDLAFANQASLSQENFEDWATKAGVQAPALRAWLASGRAGQKVDDDMRVAKAVGAFGTPAFRINGVTFSGAQPLDKFVEVVDQQLAAAKQLTQSGTPPRLVYVTLTDKNFVEPKPVPSRSEEREEEDTSIWKLPVAADDPVLGAPDALVTMIVFSDFQCPFCRHVEPTLAELRKRYGADLRIVWKDNPLPFHPRATPTALLARFIYQTRGNEAFWKLHDALFESQPKLEDSDLEALLKQLALPVSALKAAQNDKKLRERLDRALDEVSDFAVRGTPNFFINGRRVEGARPLEDFTTVIDEQRERARSLLASGAPRAKLYAELVKDGKTPPPPETKHVALSASAASRGPQSAPVVIQVFSDFQCPFCKRVEPTLAQLETEFKGSIRIVWRHMPLAFHQNAQAAAEASEEVLKQKGVTAFWKYHDLLFEQQSEPGLGRETLEQLAQGLGLDMARFKSALDERVHQAKVDADEAAGTQAGINGTPAFLVNDYFISGAQPVAAFRKVIKLALKGPAPKH